VDAEGTAFGLASSGRDGEAVDVIEATPKPRFHLRPGTILATVATLLPKAAVVEPIEETGERGALGPIVIVRVVVAGFFEVAGPSSAAAMRRVVERLAARAPFVLIDGAIDRIATLRGGRDAIVVAVGATSPTLAQVVDDVRGLVARLRLQRVDMARPFLRIEGALTAERAAELIGAGEMRQVVVGDPTQAAFGGRVFTALAQKLDLRCEHELRPIACTVAPRGPEGAFEPATFLQAVAAATGLPTYDVYAGEAVSP
jgi:hypothetical protein